MAHERYPTPWDHVNSRVNYKLDVGGNSDAPILTQKGLDSLEKEELNLLFLIAEFWTRKHLDKEKYRKQGWEAVYQRVKSTILKRHEESILAGSVSIRTILKVIKQGLKVYKASQILHSEIHKNPDEFDVEGCIIYSNLHALLWLVESKTDDAHTDAYSLFRRPSSHLLEERLEKLVERYGEEG